jgi:hypothetical protein
MPLRPLGHLSMVQPMADRVGFEPTVPLPAHLISNQAPSTTRSSLRGGTWQRPSTLSTARAAHGRGGCGERDSAASGIYTRSHGGNSAGMRALFTLAQCLTFAWVLVVDRTASGQQANALPKLPPPRPGPLELRPEASAGVGTRVSSSSAYGTNRIWDGTYSAGGWYLTPDRYAIGARYEYTGLGSGRSSTDVDTVDANFSAHTFWAAGRLLPYLRDARELFMDVRLGLTLAHQRATGTRTIDVSEPAGATFSCSAFSTPNLALGAGAGVATPVGEHWLFSTRLGVSILRGSSQVIDDCVPGLGTSVTTALTLGLAYRFGL